MTDPIIAALEERAGRQRMRRKAAMRIALVNGLLFLLGAAVAFMALRSPVGEAVALIAAVVVITLGLVSVAFIVFTAHAHARALPQEVLDAVVDGPMGLFRCNERGDVTYINSRLSVWLESAHDEDFARSLLQRALKAGSGDPRLEVRTATGRLARLTANIMDVDVGGSIGVVWRRHPFPSAGLTEPSDKLARHFVDLMEETPLGTAIVDSTGRLVSANPALTGLLDATDIEGRFLADFVAAEDRWSLIRHLADSAQTGSHCGPFEVALAGAGERSVTFMFTPLRQSGSAVRGVLLHGIDATAKRQLEQQFEQSQRLQAVGQLAGGVAHDFNNILTAITGFCDLLLRRHRPGDASYGEIMHIKRDADRAAGLVRQLLTFSRRKTPRPQVLSITRVIGELMHLLRRLIGENIELHVEQGTELGSVRADLGQLEQIITNLVVNARDAMPDGGRILLRSDAVDLEEPRATAHGMAPAGPYICLTVADEGIGIPHDIRQKIFEPFFTTKEVGKGTGLGLATVYGVLQQNEGFIEVESEPGEGAAFRVYFPRLDMAAPAALPATEDIAVDIEPESEGTILLVEDEDTVRGFAVRALRASGYKVLEAESPATAIALLDGYDGPLDLIVSDVVMPGMSGPQFVAAITKTRGPHKVIYISGYAEEAADADAIGEAEFLAKPFDLAQLVNKVRKTLASS